MAFRRALIQVEVLYDDRTATDPASLNLDEIAQEGINGDYSILTKHLSNDEITVDQLKTACDEHHTDPGFFLDLS